MKALLAVLASGAVALLLLGAQDRAASSAARREARFRHPSARAVPAPARISLFVPAQRTRRGQS